MIVQPVPTTPRSGRRQVAARLALIVPVVLLAGVVGAAVLGASGQSPRAGTAAVAGTRSPSPAEPTATPSPRPTPAPVPATVAGLLVREIPDLLADRTGAGAYPVGDLAAVHGYLGLTNEGEPCGDTSDRWLDPPGLLCVRPLIMAALPWSLSGSDGFAGIGAHVHLDAPVGVRLPDGMERPSLGSLGAPFEAVVIGRLDAVASGACRLACDTTFLMDDVAWARGRLDAQPVIGPGLNAEPADWTLSNAAEAQRRALGREGVPFVAALVRPATLDRFDPNAAAAIRDASPRGLVWYVRGIAGAADMHGAPVVAWAVVDDATLSVLASGFLPAG